MKSNSASREEIDSENNIKAYAHPSQSRFDILKIHSRKMNLMRGIDLKNN
ncbi:hypothetical protein Hanom_Chr03g00191201 [Helianthus anomalus]